MPKIQYTTTDGTSGEAELSGERMSVGRADDNAIVISDGSVSSHHGEFVLEGATWVLTDLGSTNGTKVEGERVDRLELSPGGKFELGSVTCTVAGEAPAAETHAEEAAAAPAGDWSGSAVPARTFTTGGYGSQPYNRAARTGFGPKKKEKESGRAMLMLLGFVALLACGGAAFMFMQMGS